PPPPIAGRMVGDVVADDCRCARVGGRGPSAGPYLAVARGLLAPHVEPTRRLARCQRVEGRGVGVLVEELGTRRLLRLADLDNLPVDVLRDPGIGVAEVPDQDRLGGADPHAGGAPPHVAASGPEGAPPRP